MSTFTICIGSNYNREENILFAQEQLTALFPSICFADAEETEPFLLSNPNFFTNQVARFCSSDTPEVIKTKLKAMEDSVPGAGGRHLEKIALDIDLLMCDNLVLKPKDLERDYIKRGINCLNEKTKYE